MLSQRGDTIVEVVLAFAVFSLVSVGAMTVMGQGTNASQRALEVTLVRQQIDAQAEALRAAHQAYTSSSNGAASQWRQFARANTADNTVAYTDQNTCPSARNQISNSFILDPRSASLVTDADWFQDINTRTTKPFAQVEAGGNVRSYGMWIEREYVRGDTVPDSFNFSIRACWYGAGLSTPLQLETVVRLYEPGS
jgi:type II secretory pathway pseudopilin PulG